MKYYELQSDEKEMIQAYEKGAYRRVKKIAQERAKYQSYSRATLQKTKNVNIRISEKDLVKIKSRAAEKGIPYQTLMTSVIHQYSSKGDVK